MELCKTFQYKHTKILYVVGEAFKQGYINIDEKLKIKELLMKIDPNSLSELESKIFYSEDNKLKIFENLRNLIVYKKEKEISSLNLSEIKNSPYIKEKGSISSRMSTTADHFSTPSDSAQIRQKIKKTNYLKMKSMTNLQDIKEITGKPYVVYEGGNPSKITIKVAKKFKFEE